MTTQVGKKLDQMIDGMREELIQITSELVAFKTVNPPGENYEFCARYILNKLNEIGMETSIINVEEKELLQRAPHGKGLPRPNVVGKLPGCQNSPILHFNGHYDVVPPGDGWDTSPFEPVLKGEKLYGRGSSDMKSGIAAIMVAIKAVQNCGIPLKGGIEVSFCADEETGGIAGAKYLIDNKLVHADYVIVAENAGPEIIKFAHKGVVWVEITVKGQACHGGMPFLGVNAFEKMVDIFHEIKTLEKDFPSISVDYPTQYEQLRHPTMTIGGLVSAGVGTNVVPGKCTMTIDRRLVPGESIKEVLTAIKNCIRKVQERDNSFGCEINATLLAEPAATPQDSFLCKKLHESIKERLNCEPKYIMTGGFLDMRHFVNDLGVPTVSYGPGLMKVAHKVNEYVIVEDIVKTSKVMADLIVRLLADA
jgi:succinyl-diaminopimelate desuccinylase